MTAWGARGRHLLRRPAVRLRALLGPDIRAARQSLFALVGALGASMVAGVTLGSITGTLERIPGLLVLVPAANGLRGTISGALGSRLGTAIHTGTFQLSRRADTIVGQNMIAAGVLTFVTAVGLAVLAKAVAIAFGLRGTVSIADLTVIAVVSSVVAAVVLLGLTLWLAARSVEKDWDMDDVHVPLITAAGDMVTLPLVFLTTAFAGVAVVTPALAWTFAAASLLMLVAAFRAGLPLMHRILRESLPITMVAALLSLVAGLTIEKRLDTFTDLPALLVLIPPFLASAGALGGLLSSRLASKLHLGLVDPEGFPSAEARRDIALVYVLALPIFVLASAAADLVAGVADLASPGPLDMVLISLLGGVIATTCAVAVAYYGSILAYRIGLDPDNHGIPLVTSSMDLVGAFSLIFAITAVGVA